MNSWEKSRARRSRRISSARSPARVRHCTRIRMSRVVFTLEGAATITVSDDTREVKPGDIVVIPANTPHRFVNSGDTVLRQIDIHASPQFIQTNLV